MTMQDTQTRAPKFADKVTQAVKLPAGRMMGPVTGLAIAPDGHIWALHIAAIPQYLPEAARANPSLLLPPLVEFDADGNFIQAWGGPDHLPRVDGKPQWPKQEETISIDSEGTLWIFGANKEYDHAVQRFSRDGKLLLRIGEFGKVGNDESPNLMGCPTDAYHDVARREVYITDGYVNHRVAVFNSDTGTFVRAWGAYGKAPLSPPVGPQSFNNPVHAISLGPEGHLYVCDRKNDRIQVFDAIGKATPKYIREIELKAESPFGTTFNVAFTPDGNFMIVSDGNNGRLWTVDVKAWKVSGAILAPDTEKVGMAGTIHKIVMDPDGHLLLGRTIRGVERLRILPA